MMHIKRMEMKTEKDHNDDNINKNKTLQALA